MPARVAQLVQRRPLRDRRSAQLHDDLGARRGRVRGRSGEGQQRTERDEQGTRWQPHVFRVPRTGRIFDTDEPPSDGRVTPVEHMTSQAVPGRQSRVVEIVRLVVRHADPPHHRSGADVLRAS